MFSFLVQQIQYFYSSFLNHHLSSQRVFAVQPVRVEAQRVSRR